MRKDLPLAIQRAVWQYEPINACGAVLYPVRVKDYELFQLARPALEALQQSFPVRFMSMPILQAMYQLDYEAAVNRKPLTGLFSSALLGLSLALRLGEGKELEERVREWTVKVNPKDPLHLKAVSSVAEDGQAIDITPVQYAKLRPIIAAQNGVELEDEDANPDLVKAERDLAELNGAKLNANIWQLMASVATLTGTDESEINDWAIRKLIIRGESLNRALDYLVCGIGGAFGGFGKGGNPVPHPFYEREEKNSAHMALGDFAGGAGARAVENAGKQVS